MAKRNGNRLTIDFKGFNDIMSDLDAAGGTEAMQKAVDEALIECKKYVTQELEKAMAEPNLPAHGKYSEGITKESIDRDDVVEWDGCNASIGVGFIRSISGAVPYYLMHGTPRIPTVKGLYDAVYGHKAKIRKIQEKVMTDMLSRFGG